MLHLQPHHRPLDIPALAGAVGVAEVVEDGFGEVGLIGEALAEAGLEVLACFDDFGEGAAESLLLWQWPSPIPVATVAPSKIELLQVFVWSGFLQVKQLGKSLRCLNHQALHFVIADATDLRVIQCGVMLACVKFFQKAITKSQCGECVGFISNCKCGLLLFLGQWQNVCRKRAELR